MVVVGFDLFGVWEVFYVVYDLFFGGELFVEFYGEIV